MSAVPRPFLCASPHRCHIVRILIRHRCCCRRHCPQALVSRIDAEFGKGKAVFFKCNVANENEVGRQSAETKAERSQPRRPGRLAHRQARGQPMDEYAVVLIRSALMRHLFFVCAAGRRLLYVRQAAGRTQHRRQQRGQWTMQKT